MIAEEFAYNPTTVDRAIEEHIARGVPISECLFRLGSESFLDFYNKVKTMTESMDLSEDDLELLSTDIGQTVVFEGQTVMLDVPYLEEDYFGNVEITVSDDEDSKNCYISTNAPKEEVVSILDSVSDELTISDQLSKTKELFKSKGFDINLTCDEPAMAEAEYQGKKVELNKPKRGGSKKFYVYVKDGDTVKKVSFGAKDGGGNLAVKLKDPEARKNFAARHNCPQKNDKTKPGYWACRLPRYAKSLGLSGGGTWW